MPKREASDDLDRHTLQAQLWVAGTGCPDPLNPDSDGDTLSDGAEVDGFTNPCSADTDGDGVPDDVDPIPAIDGVPPEFVEQHLQELGDDILGINLSLFVGANDAIKRQRRAFLAGLAFAGGEFNPVLYDYAIIALDGLRSRVDGQTPPSDWMMPGAQQSQVLAEVDLLISLLEQM